MKEIWDKRYKDANYAYGKEPNVFLKETLEKVDLKGSMLLPAEGEGRNAIYAAKLGLKATAFDISIEGKNKALDLEKKEGVELNYEVGDFLNPYIGHDMGYIIGKEAIVTSKTVRQLVLEKDLLSEEELDKILSVENLMHPVFNGKQKEIKS